ncbi:serine hydrolase [Micromonospora sp. LZ34]
MAESTVRAASAATRPRRTVALGLAAAVLGATLPATGAAAAERPPAGSAPPAVTPADIQFRHDTLRPGSAPEVGLLPEHVDRMPADLAAYLEPTPDHPGHPTFAGAVVLAAKDGVVVQHAAVGTAVRYSAVGPPPGLVGVELPADQQLPMRPDTIFDLASVSKLFTTIVVMQQVERGQVELDAPVARYVPEFAAGGKATVTVRMLLTHTSGLPAFTPLWSRYPTPAERFAAALATPLAAGATPGTRYVYSDLGLIALGVLVERTTGRSLADLVHDGVTAPLGMTDTGYNPGPERRSRIAATEYQPYAGRGMVWGEVHDENAWSLGGVAGHAGVFSTAADLAVLCQSLLNGGEYRGQRILRPDTVRAMLVNYNAPLEQAYPESDRGLGFELNKHWYMMGLSSPVAFGHTGFTGTSLVIDPLAHSFVILLSNRVHPDRGWGSNNVARRAVARDLAEAMPVRPRSREAWRADPRDLATVTLTAPLRRRRAVARRVSCSGTTPSRATTAPGSRSPPTAARPGQRRGCCSATATSAGPATVRSPATAAGSGGRCRWTCPSRRPTCAGAAAPTSPARAAGSTSTGSSRRTGTACSSSARTGTPGGSSPTGGRPPAADRRGRPAAASRPRVAPRTPPAPVGGVPDRRLPGRRPPLLSSGLRQVGLGVPVGGAAGGRGRGVDQVEHPGG